MAQDRRYQIDICQSANVYPRNAVVPANRQIWRTVAPPPPPPNNAEPAMNPANTLTTRQYTNHCDRFDASEPVHGGITVSSSAGPRFIFSLNAGERISAGLAGRGIR